MKKAWIFLLTLAMLLGLAGCAREVKPLSVEAVQAAYREAGYEVTRLDYPEKDYGYVHYLRIVSQDEEISFKFFETEAEAQAESEEQSWNPVLYFFTFAMGEPTWLHTDCYGSIAIEYTDSDLYGPFQELTE